MDAVAELRLMTAERADRFEGPLEVELLRQGLGQITGGGSQMAEPDDDGAPRVEFCGIDVEVTSLSAGLRLLRRHLSAVGAPVGTELHYTDDGSRLQDELRRNGWLQRRPRTFLHPGFGR